VNMHSEICPICKGLGRIPVNYPSWIPSKETKVCHGCDGLGWIEVRDNYQYPYIWPYITLPQPYKWEISEDNSTGVCNTNVIVSFEFSKKKK